jgi:hypothetical protein
MRRSVTTLALVLIGCNNDGGPGPELVPDYKLSHLTGTWQGDSDCAEGRYRIVFDRQVAGTTYITGTASLFTENATGQCLETRSDRITAHVALGGGVTVYWPYQGAPVNDRAVYRTNFVDLRHFSTGTLRLDGSPSEVVPPGEFAMAKQ